MGRASQNRKGSGETQGKTIPFVFSFEKTDGQCHADDYFGLLNCQKGRISLLIKGLWGSDRAEADAGRRESMGCAGRLGSARLGPALLGSARLGSAPPGSARHNLARHNPTRPVPCRPVGAVGCAGAPRPGAVANWMEMDGAAYGPRRGVSPRTMTVSGGTDGLTDTDLCPRAHWRPRGAYVQFAGFRLQ